MLTEIRTISVVHIFYEAPGRVLASLEVLARNIPASQVVVGRELTKIHEELVRGTALEVSTELSGREKVKGEFVFAVMGGEVEKKRVPRADISTSSSGLSSPAEPEPLELTEEQQKEVAQLMSQGLSSKDVSKMLAKKFLLPRRVIYEFIIRHLT